MSRGASFKWGGRTGSKQGGIKIQFMMEPAEMAPKVRNSIGSDMSLSLSETGCKGWVFVGDHKADKDRRREYAAVMPVAIKKRAIAIMFVGLNKDTSKIKSLE